MLETSQIQCSRIDICLVLMLKQQPVLSDTLLRRSRSRVSHHQTNSAVRTAHLATPVQDPGRHPWLMGGDEVPALRDVMKKGLGVREV